MSSATAPQPRARVASASATRAYSALVGAALLAIVLQGLWAGVFLEHDGGRDAAGTWITVHARGGEVALVAALAATVVGVTRLRPRRGLWLGAAALSALLALEGYLGGVIHDEGRDGLTAVHVPLGLAATAVAAALLARSRGATR